MVIRCLLVLYVTLLSGAPLLYGQTLTQGLWKGGILYDQLSVPFYFNVTNDSVLTLRNGDEYKVLDNVKITDDSLFVPMGVFDSEIRAAFTEITLSGYWIKRFKGSKVSFKATFLQPSEEQIEIDKGSMLTWQMNFQPTVGLEYPGVGLWHYNGEYVTGTILSEVSDFRYFEGKLTEDSISVSSFDGAHAFMVLGSKTREGWAGEMHFDNGYTERWTAQLNEDARLPDPWQVVAVEPDTHRPFYDILAAGSGRNAIDESNYFDKVLIIQLFGTWCPNSLDQTTFLVDWYKQNKTKDVEVLAISYEANYSQAYGLQRIKEYKEGLKIPYDVLLGGQLSKGQAALAFPFMDKIQAFPTLVIVDKLGYVRYVNSYFNGPATGKYYQEFITKFKQIIADLLIE